MLVHNMDMGLSGGACSLRGGEGGTAEYRDCELG